MPGNIGKPGVVLLVAPKSLRHPNHEDTLLADAPFDGELINCFKDSALHLTLTGYELPLELMEGEGGARHHETWIFEAATSVHAAGKWIGNINPLELSYGALPRSPTSLNFHPGVSTEESIENSRVGVSRTLYESSDFPETMSRTSRAESCLDCGGMDENYESIGNK
ncbi:hypothetical protein TWF102_006891 [Orbilia oligospora]|uniref:Uncharacterized protein n=1 Tax=Orbilia oligospora TaxID=2813651 RepID=A0A7C8J5G7_ORBOL|nr:hypothetical protein TWF102_006891 [Orbilia oligospora]KAF3105551.1 hypothetical protein TWF103_006610 [Orbilia oligospora]